jgi:hypothetical protein
LACTRSCSGSTTPEEDPAVVCPPTQHKTEPATGGGPATIKQ